MANHKFYQPSKVPFINQCILYPLLPFQSAQEVLLIASSPLIAPLLLSFVSLSCIMLSLLFILKAFLDLFLEDKETVVSDAMGSAAFIAVALAASITALVSPLFCLGLFLFKGGVSILSLTEEESDEIGFNYLEI